LRHEAVRFVFSVRRRGGGPPVRVDVKLVDGLSGRIVDAGEAPAGVTAPVVPGPFPDNRARSPRGTTVVRGRVSVTFTWFTSWLCARWGRANEVASD
jgi:hypothetical protein